MVSQVGHKDCSWNIGFLHWKLFYDSIKRFTSRIYVFKKLLWVIKHHCVWDIWEKKKSWFHLPLTLHKNIQIQRPLSFAWTSWREKEEGYRKTHKESVSGTGGRNSKYETIDRKKDDDWETQFFPVSTSKLRNKISYIFNCINHVEPCFIFYYWRRGAFGIYSSVNL